MKKYLCLNVFIFIFSIINCFSQFYFQNYIIRQGNYDDCVNNSMNFCMEGFVSNETDNTNTIIKLNLNTSAIKAKNYIELTPGISINSDCSSGDAYTLFSIESGTICPLKILSSTDGTVGLHNKIEIGLRPSFDILNAINKFFTNSSGRQINPYNPAHLDTNYIDVVCHLYCLNDPAKNRDIFGFFMRDYIEDLTSNTWREIPTDYPFRIRFSPDEEELWNIKVDVYSNLPSESYIFDPICSSTYNSSASFFVTPNPGNNGYLEVGHHKKYLRFHDNHQSFFAVGQNLGYVRGAWEGSLDLVPMPLDFKKHRENLINLIANEGNYARVNFEAHNYGIEWEHLGVFDKYTQYYGTSNLQNPPPYQHQWDNLAEPRNRQENAWEFDRFLNVAEKGNIYLQWTIDGAFAYNFNDGRKDINGNAINWDLRHAWDPNPYHSLGFATANDFFNSSIGRENYKKRIRYLMARWGYSNNIAAIEILNEVDGQDESNSGGYNHYDPNITASFIIDIASYIKQTLLYTNHLISASTANSGGTQVFTSSLIDYYDNHKYGRGKKINYKERYDRHTNYLSTFSDPKPYIMGELGCDPGNEPAGTLLIDQLCDKEFHNAIWSTSFMGGFGAGLQWWEWDQDGYRHNINQVANFFRNINFESDKWKPEKWKNSGPFGIFGNRYTLENYELRNNNHTRAMGWVHNATSFWENISGCNLNHTPDPDDYDSYNAVQTINPSQKFKIKALKWFTQYKVELYIPQDNTLYDSWYQSSSLGYMRVRCWDMFDYRDDYSYKVYTSGNTFRIRNEFDMDTLECGEDTLFVEGTYEEDTLEFLNYSWLVDNIDTFSGNHPSIPIVNSGMHNIKIYITDSLNNVDTIDVSIFKTDCIEEKIKYNFQHNNLDLLVKVYPNPTHKSVNVELNLNFINGSISLFNMFGENLVQKSFKDIKACLVDIDNFPSGLYLLNITLDGNTVIKKFIKE